MITIASLGMSCQTTYQLSRFTTAHPNIVKFQKGPIDWLICPPSCLANWLDAEMTDFAPGEITVHRGVAWWERFQFWFWHGFNTFDEEHKHLPAPLRPHFLDIDANFERELSKLTYQRNKFRSIDPSNTIFFLSNTQYNLQTAVYSPEEQSQYMFTEDIQQRLQDSIERFYGAPVKIHWVTRPDRATSSMLNKPNVSVLTPDEDPFNWAGNDLEWDTVIKHCLENSQSYS